MQISRRTVLALGALAVNLEGCKKSTAKELVYVSVEGDGVIAVVDPERQEVTARIPVGKRPRGLRLSRDGKQLYVALSGSPRGGPGVDESKLPPADRAADGIGVVDVATRELIATLPSGQDPESFDVSLDGKKLYVSNEETSELSEVDLEKKQVTRRVIVGGEPEGVTLRPDGKVVYVTSEEDNHVAAVDTTTFAVIGKIKVGARPRSIVFAKKGALGLVTNELDATVTTFDTEKNEARDTIAVEPGNKKHKPMGAVLSPDGDSIYVTTGRGGAVGVLELRTLTFSRRIESVGARPWGIGVSGDGKRLYTANGPSNDVSIIDAVKGTVLKRVPIGALPWGIVVG